MNLRRGRRESNDETILPLRATRRLYNTVSCWYCDYKISALNEPLSRFGRRHSGYLRIWFSMGIGFSLATLIGVTMALLFELCRTLIANPRNAWLVSSPLLGISSFITGFKISLSNIIYLCISSIISIFVHELGHALSAASENVHIEYIAVFMAVLFPGALVALNHASLQLVPSVASLRIYCAGIWHNAAFCAVCAVGLLLLPFILFPFYTHGESLMVLDVSPTSPLSGYLSPRDVIDSLDGSRIYTKQELHQKIVLLTEQSNLINGIIANGTKGYCVPHSLIERNIHVPFEGYKTNCPFQLVAFASCSDSNEYNDDVLSDNNHQKIRENIMCLDAKDVIKLKKCACNQVESSNGYDCSEAESCSTPVQLPGLGWVEITFSSLECQKNSISQENSCLHTFVFIGDPVSMERSIHLTEYLPRPFVRFAAFLPNILEKLLTCTFHVSMLIALLNSLPVFLLDGESILEAALQHYFVFLSPRQKVSILRCCLVGGTFISICFFLRTLYASVR